MSTNQTFLPVVSPELAKLGITLRPQQAEDQSFLATLYISNRWPELVQTNWSNEQKKEFLFQQYSFQHLHYSRYYDGAAWGIVELDNLPIGRLLLIQMPGDLRIVDIILAPQNRGQGIGTELLHLVFEQAYAARSKVSIHVELFNPARSLYDRLGFVQISVDGVYALMENNVVENRR